VASYVSTFSGSEINVEIDSRVNQNKFIDYTQETLFIGLATYGGTGVNVRNATYTWTLKDSVGSVVNLSTATQAQNSLIIPPRTFSTNQIFVLELTVVYNNYTGSAVIEYNTQFNTQYTFEVEPTSGVAFSTHFVISAVSQEIDAELDKFAFGYIESGKEYLLTRASQNSVHVVKLPKGETSNSLTLFLKVISKENQVFHFEKLVTVSAPTINVTDFITTINETLSDSIDESIQIKMQYNYFKDSLGTMKESALNLMIDGLQVNVQLDQDRETELTVAQVLETVAKDVASVGSTTLYDKAYNVFEQMTITENTDLANSKFDYCNIIDYTVEFAQAVFESLFNYVDYAMSSSSLSSNQATIKKNLITGIENALRGSMTQAAPGANAYILSGSTISIMAGKFTSNGYNGNALVSANVSIFDLINIE
jgi:hypothetical protein